VFATLVASLPRHRYAKASLMFVCFTPHSVLRTYSMIVSLRSHHVVCLLAPSSLCCSAHFVRSLFMCSLAHYIVLRTLCSLALICVPTFALLTIVVPTFALLTIVVHLTRCARQSLCRYAHMIVSCSKTDASVMSDVCLMEQSSIYVCGVC
jgi:hypothetical protein